MSQDKKGRSERTIPPVAVSMVDILYPNGQAVIKGCESLPENRSGNFEPFRGAERNQYRHKAAIESAYRLLVGFSPLALSRVQAARD